MGEAADYDYELHHDEYTMAYCKLHRAWYHDEYPCPECEAGVPPEQIVPEVKDPL